ncbi:hypothetical protein QTP88_019796 [Uroleucon formosanum]
MLHARSEGLRKLSYGGTEHDENETNEIPRRRVVRSDDDELSLARTNSGSLCDSKFRAVKTDARSFSFPPSIRQQPLFVQCELSAAKTLQGTPYSVDWLPLAGSVISQPIAEVKCRVRGLVKIINFIY